MNGRLRVYVAGPMLIGDLFDNVHFALRIGRKLVADGLAPFVPHLDAYMYLGAPQSSDVLYEDMLAWDLEWVAVAEAVLRLPGESVGADRETARGQKLGIPVFHLAHYDALIRYADNAGRRAVREEA